MADTSTTIEIDFEDGRTWTYHEGDIYQVKIYSEVLTGQALTELLGSLILWLDTGEYDGSESCLSVGVLARDLEEVLDDLAPAQIRVTSRKLTEAGQSGDNYCCYAYFPLAGGWFVYYE